VFGLEHTAHQAFNAQLCYLGSRSGAWIWNSVPVFESDWTSFQLGAFKMSW